ncbi:hypothetical protein [Actinoplanes teichomyceticus]|uniref:Uncharacterized protein n=1 Tax=Actinoplanes teichomyceticus TaxID=1867 RepID=A0A561WAT8_ACTTI|nr:hypothetical protein [Actinoplanes teichomyceticus]TWG20972.1 hypothetical protein FHX34_103501 [Actinoplanes teichomyceticus]GIF14792.1 hypothetical protein Ate01nite_48240 [Actinoplanes teichomyceticus]
MARKLRTFVTVHERDDKGELTGQSGTFGPADKLPDWAAKAITNPDVWDGEESDEPARPSAPAPGAVPARSGPGSGVEKWREYATSQGVDVPEGASRDDMIAALDAAGKPTK